MTLSVQRALVKVFLFYVVFGHCDLAQTSRRIVTIKELL